MALSLSLLILIMIVASFYIGYWYHSTENPPVTYEKPKVYERIVYDRKKVQSVVSRGSADRYVDGGGAWGNVVLGGQTKSVTNLLEPRPVKKPKLGIVKSVWSYLRSV